MDTHIHYSDDPFNRGGVAQENAVLRERVSVLANTLAVIAQECLNDKSSARESIVKIYNTITSLA